MSTSMSLMVDLRRAMQSLLEQWRSNCRFIEQQRAMYALDFRPPDYGPLLALLTSMNAQDLLKKAATAIRLQLACIGIQGQALYDCAISEAAADAPASIARAGAKFRAHALMRLHLLGDAGPGDLSGKLRSMTPEAIALACEDAASQSNVDKLEGFDPSAARNVPHWSDTDED